MNDSSGCPRVERNPGKHSGDWLFVGMRVPVAPFENLAAGASVEALLNWFEGVEEWQVKSALQSVPEYGDRMSPV